MSGDVHLNPGSEYPCGKRGLNVHDDDKALCCDGCNKWIHVSCDQYISETIYDELVHQPSSDPWFELTALLLQLKLIILSIAQVTFAIYALMHEAFFPQVVCSIGISVRVLSCLGYFIVLQDLLLIFKKIQTAHWHPSKVVVPH